MSNLKASTLRPGLLVSVKTSIRGNVTYSTRDLDPDHIESDGSRQARWETERRIADPQEHGSCPQGAVESAFTDQRCLRLLRLRIAMPRKPRG